MIVQATFLLCIINSIYLFIYLFIIIFLFYKINTIPPLNILLITNAYNRDFNKFPYDLLQLIKYIRFYNPNHINIIK